MEDALIASALQHDVDPNIRRVASLGPPLLYIRLKLILVT